MNLKQIASNICSPRSSFHLLLYHRCLPACTHACLYLNVEASLSRGFAACVYLLVVLLTCAAAGHASGSSQIRGWVFLGGAGAFRTCRAVEEKHAISPAENLVAGLQEFWRFLSKIPKRRSLSAVVLPGSRWCACRLNLVGCGS